MKDDPLRSSVPPKLPAYSISGHVFAYALLCTLAVSLAMTLVMAFLAWSTMRESRQLQVQAQKAQESSDSCHVALERADAKLEMVDGLFERVRPKMVGGGP